MTTRTFTSFARHFGLACALTFTATGCRAAAANGHLPTPKIDEPPAAAGKTETAIFAGGCFWGTQSVFQRVKGVRSTTAGYAGGVSATATYDQVTTETTGHAESVQVVYDPSKITYGKLLQIFFSVHDPTTLNRQGPDSGTSYRSEIFAASPEQARVASAYIAQLNAAKVFNNPIVTRVEQSKAFYAGESYHQDYATLHPENPYIQVCDRPKLETLKKEFPELFVEYVRK